MIPPSAPAPLRPPPLRRGRRWRHYDSLALINWLHEAQLMGYSELQLRYLVCPQLARQALEIPLLGKVIRDLGVEQLLEALACSAIAAEAEALEEEKEGVER